MHVSDLCWEDIEVPIALLRQKQLWSLAGPSLVISLKSDHSALAIIASKSTGLSSSSLRVTSGLLFLTQLKPIFNN